MIKVKLSKKDIQNLLCHKKFTIVYCALKTNNNGTITPF